MSNDESANGLDKAPKTVIGVMPQGRHAEETVPWMDEGVAAGQAASLNPRSVETGIVQHRTP